MCMILEVLKVYVKKLSDQNDPGTVDYDSEQQYYSRTILYCLALLGFQSKMWNQMLKWSNPVLKTLSINYSFSYTFSYKIN